MPNLNADRPVLIRVTGFRLNVRRLMYQSLIWLGMLGDEARGMLAVLDAERLEREADALVDGMRGDFEAAGDFLGGQMLVDQA